jgi:hypothetical protein
MRTIQTHLSSKHRLDKTSPFWSASYYKSKRLELCLACNKEQRNKWRHFNQYCLLNPFSKASVLAAAKLKASQPPATTRVLVEREVAQDPGAEPRAGPSRELEEVTYAKGGTAFLGRLKVFLSSENSTRTKLTKGTAEGYLREAKRIVEFWEKHELEGDFYMDMVSEFTLEPAVRLPSIENYMVQLDSYSKKHNALNAYPQMIKLLKFILTTQYVNKFKQFYDYQAAKDHLETMADDSKQFHAVVNKNKDEERHVKDGQKFRNNALKISTQKMTNLLHAYHQSHHVKMLKARIISDYKGGLLHKVFEQHQVAYLLMSLILIGCGGHRGDAVRKMQVGEFLHAPLVGDKKVVHIQHHKTRKTTGPAVIPLIEDSLQELMEVYLKDIRLKFDPSTADPESRPETSLEEPFFVNTHRGMFNDMRGVVQFIRKVLTEKVKETNVPKDFTASAVRTWVANISADFPEAEKRMNHSKQTHDTHYMMAQAGKMVDFSQFVLNTLGQKQPVTNGNIMIELDQNDEQAGGGNDSDSALSARSLSSNGGAARGSSSPASRVSSTRSTRSGDPPSPGNNRSQPSQSEGLSSKGTVFTWEERLVLINTLSNGKEWSPVTVAGIKTALEADQGSNPFVPIWNVLVRAKGGDEDRARRTIISSLRSYYRTNRGKED